MGQKTPELASERFTHFFSETLSCVTTHGLIGIQKKRLNKITFYPPAPVYTNAGAVLFVSVTHVFTIVEDKQEGGYKVSSREYFYKLADNPYESEHDKGVFSYHWHPISYPIRHPHLHITITPILGYHGLELRINRAHYPTSRVCVEDFVRLLIEGYDIKPRCNRSEWSRILRKNKTAFHNHATWSISPPSL